MVRVKGGKKRAVRRTATKRKSRKQHNHNHVEQSGENLRDIILGGQDGLVNVLGIVLAVGVATMDTRIVLVAGLAATFAESISMAAVAYTSSKAALAYYLARLSSAKEQVEYHRFDVEKEIRHAYQKKGFSGRLLDMVVKRIAKSRSLTLQTLIEARRLSPDEYQSPKKDAFIVGFSALLGSLVPMFPFFFWDVKAAIIMSLVVSSIALFVTGAFKAKLTVGTWWRSGLEIFFVGMTAAIAGFAIGYFFGVM